MSYKITSLYGLPHGHAVAVCLPEIWKYMLSHPENCVDYRGQEYLSGIFQNIANAMGEANPYAARDIFTCMMSDMELQNPVSNNRAAEMEILSKSVNPIRLKNNPVLLDGVTIHSIYDVIIQ